MTRYGQVLQLLDNEEEAQEAEVAEALGRDYYEAGAAPGAGYRNGYAAPARRDELRRPSDPRLHPGLTQEVAPHEKQRDPKATT